MFMIIHSFCMPRPLGSFVHSQRGASLIEVMVAVMIVGFALLGMGGMQAKAISVNQSSYYRGVAADLGADLADRIRALNSPYLASTDATRQPPKPPDFSKCALDVNGALACANQEADVTSYPGPHRSGFQARVNSEMQEWDNFRKSQLPSGSSFTLAQTAASAANRFRYTLTITWRDDRQANADSSYTVVIE